MMRVYSKVLYRYYLEKRKLVATLTLKRNIGISNSYEYEETGNSARCCTLGSLVTEINKCQRIAT